MTTTFKFDIDNAWSTLRHVSVIRAVNYLAYVFDCQDDKVLLDKSVTTPQQIAYASNSIVRARYIPIQFWGGPPGDEEWHEGSLLALLIDRLFYNIAVGNVRTVQRFQESFARTHAR